MRVRFRALSCRHEAVADEIAPVHKPVNRVIAADLNDLPPALSLQCPAQASSGNMASRYNIEGSQSSLGNRPPFSRLLPTCWLSTSRSQK